MDNKKRKEEEKHYIDLYNSTNTNARGIAVDYFYFKHENYIKKLMGEFCPTYKVKYYDDLLSSGKVGIMEALQKFDPEKGRFTTWSKRYIIHEFLNFLCEIVFQCSVYYAKLQNKIRKVIKKLELEGIKYTFEDICEQSGLSKKIVKRELQMQDMVILSFEQDIQYIYY